MGRVTLPHNEGLSRLERQRLYGRSPQGLATARKYREANKEKARAASKASQRRALERNKPFFDSHKSGCGCSMCGERDFRCLDYHHKDPESKAAHVSELYSCTRERIWQEVRKCVVLCSNCHRKVTHYGEEVPDVA